VTDLSTQVLDLASGQPAADVAVRLYRRREEEPLLISEARTDTDGRARLIDPGQLSPGAYRLAFEIGAYFARTGGGGDLDDPPFLDVVIVDFNVADGARHHHIPLLVSPFGYSTLRGG
jgi:5-hydroxyisourate hydrolase